MVVAVGVVEKLCGSGVVEVADGWWWRSRLTAMVVVVILMVVVMVATVVETEKRRGVQILVNSVRIK